MGGLIMRPLVALGAVTIGTAASVLACSSASEPDEGAPAVVVAAVADPPSYDTQTYALYCLAGPENGSPILDTCPIVRWAGYEYWALNYTDNRSSMAIHAYDQNGTLTSVVERVGARYVNTIEIDDASETVIFRGQQDRTITMTWQELRDQR
jgi:hypothetical protein